MNVKSMSVAEAKRDFSELMGNVVYNGDEFIIKRRGKPMVAIVRPEYLELIHNLTLRQETKGLLGIVGKFDDSQDFVNELERIYSRRETLQDREVSL